MDFKENYYFEKYEQLAVLADTQKCKTILSRNTDTNEIVVFKVMDKHGLDVYDRLKDLDNSNIVDVMDCFLHEDKCVAVEEFVNGKRLCDVLQKNIPVEVIVDYVRQICNGLKEVHNKNIVHRDLQPKNIIVDRHNHITIIDFDIEELEKKKPIVTQNFLERWAMHHLSSLVLPRQTSEATFIPWACLLAIWSSLMLKPLGRSRGKKLCTPVPVLH